jgi:hypothetical protein
VVGRVVLHEQVSNGDVGAKEFLMVCDWLKNVLAVVQHKLQIQAADRRARVAGAGH